MKNQLCRSGLYASASSPSRIAQAIFYEADQIIYDLEDSVAPSEKDAARLLVFESLKGYRPEDTYISIRINGMDTVYFEEDLQAAVRAKPDGLRIPKVESAEEVHTLSEKISVIEHKIGLPEGEIDLWCLIESYRGLLNAREIAKADPRVKGLILGAEDYTADIGAKRTREGWEIFHARNMLLLACREAGIAAIDIVYSDIQDTEGLDRDLQLSRDMGFDGRTVIHPSQVERVNAAYMPSAREIAHAKAVVEAAEKAAQQGKGVIAFEGRMLDKPVELRARKVLSKAKAAGVKL